MQIYGRELLNVYDYCTYGVYRGGDLPKQTQSVQENPFAQRLHVLAGRVFSLRRLSFEKVVNYKGHDIGSIFVVNSNSISALVPFRKSN